MRGSWRPNKDCNILTSTLMAISVVPSSFSRVAQPETRRLSFLLSAGFLYHILSPTGLVSKTDWLPVFTELYNSSIAHLISPITGHRDVSLPLSLEWHVWLSSSGNNCHAVHRSLSSGASVCECNVGFYLVPFCQPSSHTPMEYALSPSLEWHVWPGRRSIYNTTTALFCYQIGFNTVRIMRNELKKYCRWDVFQI